MIQFSLGRYRATLDVIKPFLAAPLIFSALLIGNISNAIAQSTAIPITRIVFPQPGAQIRPVDFVVPDSNPHQVSAYGGKLTRHDVYIAKMFEITHYECLRDNKPNVVIWRYYTAGGNRKYGFFEITCQRAIQTVNTYGLGQTEATEITYYRATPTIDIPILDITGSKVDQWHSFVGTLRPGGMD